MKKILKLLNNYQIPGFRSQHNWKSIIAAIGYFIIVIYSFAIMVTYSFWYGLLWFIALIAIIFLFCNYRGILDKISKVKLKNYIVAIAVSMFIIGSVFAVTPEPKKPVKENIKETLPVQPSEVKGEQISTETREEKIIDDIPFNIKETDDSTIKKGEQKIKQEGKNGKKEKIYKVTYENNKEIKRDLISENTIEEPVEKIILIGTYEEKTQATTSNNKTDIASPQNSNCDPNYSGACVPIDTDVDCAEGSGNGPSYVKGPVKVIGSDIYGLDSDHDGLGCE